MKKTSKGFTLIELLVVIAIIAILAAILFPVFSSAKEKARSSQCINNMNQLGKAMRMYLDAHEGRYPSAVPLGDYANSSRYGYYYQGKGVQGESSGNHFNIYERGGLWPYVAGKGVYVCPSDYNQYVPRTDGGTQVGSSAKTKRPFGLSYSMNLHLTNTGTPASQEASANGHGGNVKCLKDSDIRVPSKTVLFIDEGVGCWRGDGVYPICDGHFGPNIDWPSKIHYDGTNYTFCDGHAEWVKMSYDGYGELIWYNDYNTGKPWKVPTGTAEFKAAIDSPRVKK